MTFKDHIIQGIEILRRSLDFTPIAERASVLANIRELEQDLQNL